MTGRVCQLRLPKLGRAEKGTGLKRKRRGLCVCLQHCGERDGDCVYACSTAEKETRVVCMPAALRRKRRESCVCMQHCIERDGDCIHVCLQH